jgi:predicted RNA-binding Zn ribbon-like protein
VRRLRQYRTGRRRDARRPLDRLRSAARLSVEAQTIGAAEAAALQRQWSGHADAGEALDRAIELRRALRAMLEGIAAGRRDVPTPILDTINEVLRDDVSGRQVVRSRHGYEIRTTRTVDTPARLLVAVAESAAMLLSSDDMSLVRPCQNPECLLFFYDTTKNHRRRWCSMAACGNRAKVAAHYRRAQQPPTRGRSAPG